MQENLSAAYLFYFLSSPSHSLSSVTLVCLIAPLFCQMHGKMASQNASSSFLQVFTSLPIFTSFTIVCTAQSHCSPLCFISLSLIVFFSLLLCCLFVFHDQAYNFLFLITFKNSHMFLTIIASLFPYIFLRNFVELVTFFCEIRGFSPFLFDS